MAQRQGRGARAQQVAARERHRRKRREQRYQPGRRLTHDQQAVAQRLTAGRIDLVTVSGWGFVAPFLAFLDRVGYCALLDLEGQGFVRVMIPIARLVLTYHLKVLLGIGSINLVPTKLFRELALLQLIGYTTTQLQAGYCQRGHLAVGPMHKNTLADAVERLTPEELASVLNGTVQRLGARGCFQRSPGHFALDATDLETTRHYQGAGVKRYTERKRGKDKTVVAVERLTYGFKLLIVYEVHLHLVAAATVVPINEHESQYTRLLVQQAVTNLGASVLRVLLIDRGFLDGADLWWLKQTCGIDFVVPAKDDMRVTADARALCRRRAPATGIVEQARAGRRQVGKDGRVRYPGQVTVVAVPALRSYDQYGDAAHAKRANRKDFEGHPLNAVVVTQWAGEAYAVGAEKVFLTSLPVALPLAVLDLYDLRSLIENTAFRELKQGWGLTHYPKKTAAAVRAHVFLTVLTFTLVNAFRTAAGQALTQHGIRRLRAEQESAKVLVFAGEHYGIFDIEEIFLLLGVVPQQCLRTDPARLRRRYGLPAVA
jgi:Transposase DDE domain